VHTDLVRFPFFRPRPRKPEPAAVVAPRRGSPAEVWLGRSEKAVRSLGDLGHSIQPGPTADQLVDIQLRATSSLDSVRRIAGQVTLVDQAIARIPSPALTERRARLAGQVAAGGSDELRVSQEQAVADIDAQLASDARLRSTRDALLARMEAAAVGLEGLVARAAEASTMAEAATPDLAAGEIGELAAELDGLRAGLAETEQLSRGALGGPTNPPFPPGAV
jgi:hypothetical protein